jgi:hypothetical protein
MRRLAAICGSATVFATAFAQIASAAEPPQLMTRLLTRASGTNSISVSAPTRGLSNRVWLHQTAGVGTARASVTVICRKRQGRFGTGSVGRFSFTSRRGGWQELWRYLGTDCTIEVTLKTDGHASVELRGR